MAWEFDLLYWFQGLHHPVLDKIAVAVTSLGNSGMFWILLTIAMLIFAGRKRRPGLRRWHWFFRCWCAMFC